MSSSEPSRTKFVLYLQHIDVETAIKRGVRVALQIDGRDVDVQRAEPASTWAPSRSLELPETSKITVIIKAGGKVGGVSFRRVKALCEVSTREAVDAFWNSTDSISHTIVFDGQPATITFKFRPSPTSEDIRAAVERLQREMQTYRTVMSDSTERNVDFVFNHSSKLANMNPIVGAVFGVAKGSFEVLKQQKKHDRMVSDLAESVDGVLPFAERLLDEIVCEETDLLDRAVRRMCALIIDTADFVCSYAKQSQTARAKMSTDINALQGDLSRLKKEFDHAVDITSLETAKRNEQFRLIDRLKPIDAASYQQHRGCMEETRTGILSHLSTWASKEPKESEQSNSPNDSQTTSGAQPDNGFWTGNMCWLYGSPGLGKTSVANSFCDRLHDDKKLGGSFFCRQDDPILRESGHVLPTLVSRLAGMWGPYRKLVARALNDDPHLHPDLKCGALLLKLLPCVRMPPPSSLVLVVDALDECGDPKTRTTLLKCLFEACCHVPWIKVIITSRPENDIKTFFERNVVTAYDLAIDDLSRDSIRFFTRQRMKSIASDHYLPPNWPGEDRLQQIVERSGGLFIFVDTVCRLLNDPDPEPVLARLLDGRSEDANIELYRLYSKAIIPRIGQSKEKFRSFVRAVVVVAKHRPLPDDTLAALMGLEHGIVRSWVDRLSSLLYRDGSQNGGVRVRHLSVIDFLTGTVCPEEFRVVLQEANEELSLRCIATMTRELEFDICKLETSCLPNAEIQDLDKRVKLKVSDWLQYSCMHWADHLCSYLNPGTVEVSPLLDEFFTAERPLYWMEVMSLMGKVPAAILALRKIKATAKNFEGRQQDLVNDALQFLHAFFTPISTSTPHIYISALPFTPVGSSLRKNSANAFQKLLNVYKGNLKSWPAPAGILLGHTEYVMSATYSPDGQRIVSGSRDKTIRIWDAESGVVVGEPLRGHINWVTSVAYSPDGQRIISGSYDNTIWDAVSGAAVGEPLRGHTNWVTSVAYSPDGQRIVSGSQDKTIRIWDAESGVAAGEPLRGHINYVTSVAYSPDGQRIISGSYDDTIRIWDAESGVAAGEPLRGHINYVTSVAYSPDGQRIISGSYDDTIRIWDAESGVAVGEPLRGHTNAVMGVAYSPDGQRIISGSYDKTIRIWDAESGVAVGEPLRGLTNAVTSVAYSPDGQHIISSSEDNTIRMWDAESGVAVGEPLRGHTNWVTSVAYSPDVQRIISGSYDKTIRIWDAVSGAAVGEPLRGHTDAVTSVTYSPDGQCIISGSWDNTIRIWDAESGVAVGESLRGHTNWVTSVAYSPDGQRIISGSYEKTIRIWDTESGVAVGEPLKGHTNWVTSVACSPDGQRIISGSYDDTIRIWDAESGVAVGEPLRGHTDVVTSVAYSSDGQHIISGSWDRTIRIWDAGSGAAVGEPLRGHTNAVTSVACSSDSQRIISSSWDRTIRIWDAESGVAVGEPLSGHTNWVTSVAYSPDVQRIISGSYDNTIRIWDAESGVAVSEPLRGHTNAVTGVAYSPDGRRVIPGSDDNTIRVRDVGMAIDGGEALNWLISAVNSVSLFPDRRTIHHVTHHLPDMITNAKSHDPAGGALLSALSRCAIPENLLDPNGWICGPDGRIFWVPEDCRHGLTRLPILTIPITGRERCVRVDITNFRYGTSWHDVYETRHGEESTSHI